MTQSISVRALPAFLILVLEIMQAWDSDVFEAGLLTVLLVSLAMPLAPIALLIPVRREYMIGVLALVLLIQARMLSPIPLPGLYIMLVPAAMGLIFAGLSKQEN